MNLVVALNSDYTPLAGRDNASSRPILTGRISTHTPLAGRDFEIVGFFDGVGEFLLTRPLRGATSCELITLFAFTISTHTPLAGRDHFYAPNVFDVVNFYSHAPCGARRISYSS